MENEVVITEGKDINMFNRLWYKFIPFWPLFLILLIFSVADAWVFLKLKNPIYETNATILIKDEKKGYDDSRIEGTINVLSPKKIIENEIEVIQSRTLFNEVVNKLQLYVAMYKRAEFKRIPVYKDAPVFIQAKQPDSLVTAMDLQLAFDRSNNYVRLQGIRYALDKWYRTSYGIIKFVPNPQFSDTSNAKYEVSIYNSREITSLLLKNLEVSSASKQSSIVTLSYKNEIPQKGEDILNGLIDAYVNASIIDKTVLAKNTLAFIDDRLNLVSAELDTIDLKLESYKTTKGAMDISSQGKVYLGNVSEVDQKLNSINIQLSVLDQVENYVKNKDRNGNIVPSTLGIEDPILTSLLEKLYEQELEYEKLKKTTGANSQFMQAVVAQIEKIKPSILDNIQNHRAGLAASREKLNSANQGYSSQLDSLPKKERDLLEISRARNVLSNIHDFLLQKREETALSNISIAPDSRVVDRAMAAIKPVSPKPVLIYIIAVLAACAGGIGLILISEWLKKTVMFRSEIEANTTVPVIGEISQDKTKVPIVISEGDRSFIAEQYRRLRTSLRRIGISGERNRLLVSSSISGEGKSFVVANLGLTIALTGKKVVLLELDLSNPSLSAKLEIPAGLQGLSEYLSGAAEPEDIIRRVPSNENLFIIPSGKLPKNPSELIVSGQLEKLLLYLSSIFDFVLIDSAPIGLLSDAYIISEYCHATLFVVRHGYTPKVALKRLNAQNEINQLKNPAIVFNGIKGRGFFVTGYGYGYGYGYVDNTGKMKKSRR